MRGDPARFSLNAGTVPDLDLPGLLQAADSLGMPAVALSRALLDGRPLPESVRLLQRSGLAVSSLARGGSFTETDPARRRAAREDNRRALEQTAEIGAPTLVVVAGGMNGTPLADARARAADGLAELGAEAAALGVRISLEPLHPMVADARSVVVTLALANDLVADLPDHVGIAWDAFHLWWDPRLAVETARAADRIHTVQVADWIGVPDGVMQSRGMPGEGCIDFGDLLALTQGAGYQGFVEIEVFSRRWREAGTAATIEAVRRSLRDVLGFRPA